MSTGIIFDIKRYAINDGPGIRTAVFFKGCPLACWWCHNPEGQLPQPQMMFRYNRCKGSRLCLEVCPLGAIHWENGPVTDWAICDQCGKCVEHCYAGAREMVGRETSVEALMAEIERDIPFYDQSGGGVTFTGGEPLMQVEFLEDVLRMCKNKHIHTAVDTSGQAAWSNIQKIQPYTDLFLYDLKLIDPLLHRKYTSLPNTLILGNLQKLAGAGAHIIVRMPLIPGINDDPGILEQSATFLTSLRLIDGVEIMPYHDIGVAKFQALGMSYKLTGIKSPSKDNVEAVENLFASHHLPVIRHTGRML